MKPSHVILVISFLFSVFSLPSFHDHVFFVFVFLSYSLFLKKNPPFLFFKKSLVYPLLVRSPLVILPFYELFHFSTSVFHLYFVRLFQNLPLLLCAHFSLVLFFIYFLCFSFVTIILPLCHSFCFFFVLFSFSKKKTFFDHF